MGIIYAFMIDRAVFMYEFKQNQMILGAIMITIMVISYFIQVLKKIDWVEWIPFRSSNESDLDKIEGPQAASPSPEGPNGEPRTAPSFGISPFSPWK